MLPSLIEFDITPRIGQLRDYDVIKGGKIFWPPSTRETYVGGTWAQHKTSKWYGVEKGWETLVYWIGIQIQCSMQTHCFKKTFNLILIKLKKYLIAEGSSGSNGWARVNSERMYSREPLLWTIFFDSRHLQIARGKPTWNENIWTLTMPNEKSQS